MKNAKHSAYYERFDDNPAACLAIEVRRAKLARDVRAALDTTMRRDGATLWAISHALRIGRDELYRWRRGMRRPHPDMSHLLFALGDGDLRVDPDTHELRAPTEYEAREAAREAAQEIRKQETRKQEPPQHEPPQPPRRRR